MIKSLSHHSLRSAALAALAIGAPVALFAQGTYYVPIADSDASMAVFLSVDNPTGQVQSFEVLPIPENTNGVPRPTSPARIDVPANRTMVYENLTSRLDGPAMVELTTHGGLSFHAYTQAKDSSGKRVGLRQQIPIVDSTNLVPGGTRAFVNGIRRDSRRRSDYAILNLSQATSTCEHWVRGHDGAWVVAPQAHVLNHLPLSLVYVTDVLHVVGVEAGDRYTVSTSCADDFYVAALVTDSSNHRISVLRPSRSRASSLRPPSDNEPSPTPDPVPSECPAGRVCFDMPGAFHRATAEEPAFGKPLPVPPGVYTRATFRFRLHHGGWSEESAKRHLLFWFARSGHNDLFGFGQVRGPGGPPQVFFRSDFDVLAHEKQRVTANFLMLGGETYDIFFDFDTANDRIVLSLTDSTGTQVMRSVGQPNISEIVFEPGHVLRTAFGFPGNEWESPGIGWVWSDLHIELERR